MEKLNTQKLIQNAQGSLVRALDEEALVNLLMRGEVQKLAAGTEFVKEGQTKLGGLYFIVDGLVSQDQKASSGVRRLTGAMDRGEFLGEVSATGEVLEQISSVSLRAQMESTLVFIPKAALEAWCNEFPEQEAKFVSVLISESHDRQLFADSVIGNS